MAAQRGGFAYQTRVLADRYFEVFLADLTNLFFLIFQPLAVAGCVGLIWQGQRTSDILYFVILFSSIFFGCVNACREIVKEKAIYQRERLVGLNLMAYLSSKVFVLAVMGLAQIILFYVGIRFFMPLPGNPLLLCLTLYGALLSGSCLGLLVSSVVATDVVALACVPICLIPQLLFSELVMPNRALTGALTVLKNSMIVTWGYLAMQQVYATQPDWFAWFKGMALLGLMSVTMLLLASLGLKAKEV